MVRHLNTKMKFRDIQVADDIRKRAELGWFDVEFTMFGCAYWDKSCDQMFFKVGPKAEEIYDFIEKSMCLGIYPSNIMSISEQYPVPAGMKELFANDVKLKLGKKLRETYPKNFFEVLDELADRIESNSSAKLLWRIADYLEGSFDEIKLKEFENLIHYAKSSRKINREQYNKLIGWMIDQYRDMEDDVVEKDIFEKKLFGIVYEENGKRHYFETACKEFAYNQMYIKEMEGRFVTPIIEKTFWYNYRYRLKDVKRDFHKNMVETVNDDYIYIIKKIKKNEEARRLYNQENLLEMEEQLLKEQKETFRRYLTRWGLRNDIKEE